MVPVAELRVLRITVNTLIHFVFRDVSGGVSFEKSPVFEQRAVSGGCVQWDVESFCFEENCYECCN